MGRTLAPSDFILSGVEEPHAQRKVEILKKYPEIKKLFGYEWRTKYMVLATVVLQTFMAWLTLELRWPAYLAVIYVVGGTANHSLFLAIHELSHGLGAGKIWQNKAISLLANFPIVIAYFTSFKPYHMDHHRYQGHDGVDTDVPTPFEGWLLHGSSFGYIDRTLRKGIVMFCQIFTYALRPTFVKPNAITIDRYYIGNWVGCLTFDAVIVLWLGPTGLLYLLLSTFFAGSIHPMAGHFIAEHYVMDGTAETYSYYGPLNRLAYNVGYHNEHHDFPNIPWSGLAKVRQIAPEFYDHLPECKSWPGTILRYIFDDSISPYSRVKRHLKTELKDGLRERIQCRKNFGEAPTLLASSASRKED